MTASPHPHIPALHSEERDSSAQNLSDWATVILASHKSPDAVLEWQISSVQWFKNKSGWEHEYPVFTLRNMSNPNTEVIYLRFDRSSSKETSETRKKENIVKQDVYLDLTAEQSQNVTSASKKERPSLLVKHLKAISCMPKLSTPITRGFYPKDTITRSRHANGVANGGSENVELLATYSNFSHPFPLRDLAIIAKTVVASADTYSLFVQQCYWFTRTMVGISVAKYNPLPAEGINILVRDRSGRINQLQFVPVINKENPDKITKLVDLVRGEIAEDNQKVRDRYMNGEGGRKKAEEGRAAAEEASNAAESARTVAENARVLAVEGLTQAENRIRELQERVAKLLPREIERTAV